MAQTIYEFCGIPSKPTIEWDGDAIEAEFDAVARGFDTIEDLVNVNKAGYPTQTLDRKSVV